VNVTAKGFAALEQVTITFIDPVVGKTDLGTFESNARGNLDVEVTIPDSATVGAQKIKAAGLVPEGGGGVHGDLESMSFSAGGASVGTANRPTG
jgi:hypothetical protein